MNIVIVITLGVVTLIIVIVAFDAIRGALQALLGRCRLVRFAILPDMCLGGCPPSPLGRRQNCVAVRTRPYLRFFTQAAACACVVPPAAPGGGAGGDGEENEGEEDK